MLRVQDVYHPARSAAVSALHLLHNPQNENDRVVKEFKRLLISDQQKYMLAFHFKFPLSFHFPSHPIAFLTPVYFLSL
jgi:hypothetical protein